MARKLKSDKLLFTATVLLVCTSVVMVYSASAVIAMERYQQPYFFLFKQLTWALIGLLGIQPSELAKIVVILFTAALLERRMERIDDVRSLLPIGVVVGIVVGLILA